MWAYIRRLHSIPCSIRVVHVVTDICGFVGVRHRLTRDVNTETDRLAFVDLRVAFVEVPVLPFPGVKAQRLDPLVCRFGELSKALHLGPLEFDPRGSADPLKQVVRDVIDDQTRIGGNTRDARVVDPVLVSPAELDPYLLETHALSLPCCDRSSVDDRNVCARQRVPFVDSCTERRNWDPLAPVVVRISSIMCKLSVLKVLERWARVVVDLDDDEQRHIELVRVLSEYDLAHRAHRTVDE